MSHFRAASRLVALGVKTAGWVGAVSAHQRLVPEAERDALFQAYMKRWAHSLVSSSGGVVELTPESRVPPQRGPRLVIANHRSPFDIGVLLHLFGGHALSRADLAHWPILGLAARRAGTIFVDRESAHSGASAIREIRRRLMDGASVLVFPEGRTAAGDEVLPFKSGIFTAMRGLDVELVPVGLAYDPGSEWVNETFVGHVLRVARRPTTRIVVHIGAPRIVRRRTPNLPEELRADVQKLVLRAREHWRHTSRSDCAK
jgi:1-acyl-sn-glycerol-3-phosphate acyltransferase